MLAIIREESAGDEHAVEGIHRLAFGREDEAGLVAELRRLPSFDRELSLVAAVGDEVAGHILFTPVTIAGQSVDQAAAVALAPLAVRPDWQRRGIGSQLVRAGLIACRTRGHRFAIVVGHPEYYPRFGFRRARQLGFEVPFAVSDAAFMICELVPGACAGLRGMVEYPQPFLSL
jgi:putative acetyltransferase